MKFGKVFSYITGSLTVCADGPFTERLINICMHRGLTVRNVKRCGSSRVIFNTDIQSFLQMRVPAKRTKSHVRIVHRHGLPFLLRRYRGRRFAVCGAVILAVMLWYASTHVMGITVFGNQRIDTDLILSKLSECGLTLGSKTSEVSSDHIRNRMMTDIGDIAWLGINANGSRVYVEVVERIEKEKGLENEDIPCNLTASRDAEIERVEVREGQTLVKIGSGVREGDVLVSGVVDNAANGFRYVHSRGEVFAKTVYSKTRSYPLTYTENIPTGKTKKRYTVSILGHELPLFFGKTPYEIFSREETTAEYRIPIDMIPSLFIKSETYTEEYTESKTRTPNEAIEFGISELSAELHSELGNGVEPISQNNIHTLTERGEVEITVELVCRENIAVQSPIERALPDSDN